MAVGGDFVVFAVIRDFVGFKGGALADDVNVAGGGNHFGFGVFFHLIGAEVNFRAFALRRRSAFGKRPERQQRGASEACRQQGVFERFE